MCLGSDRKKVHGSAKSMSEKRQNGVLDKIKLFRFLIMKQGMIGKIVIQSTHVTYSGENKICHSCQTLKVQQITLIVKFKCETKTTRKKKTEK